jgi:hypothetical protein
MKMKLKSLVTALLLGTLVSTVIGAEPAATAGKTPNPDAKVAQPPAGVRISIDGNSWSVWPGLLLPLAKEAGIQGQIDGTKEAKQRLCVQDRGTGTAAQSELPLLLSSGLADRGRQMAEQGQ